MDRVITSRKSRKRAPKPRSQRTIPQRPHAPAATAPAAATDGKDARDADLADAELTDRIADDLEDDIEEVGEGMDAAGCAVQGVRAHKPKDDSRQASPETPADGASSLGDESFLNDGQPYAAPQPGCYEYLVKWKGLEYGEATWEHELDLTAWDDKVRVTMQCVSVCVGVGAR